MTGALEVIGGKCGVEKSVVGMDSDSKSLSGLSTSEVSKKMRRLNAVCLKLSECKWDV